MCRTRLTTWNCNGEETKTAFFYIYSFSNLAGNVPPYNSYFSTFAIVSFRMAENEEIKREFVIQLTYLRRYQIQQGISDWQTWLSSPKLSSLQHKIQSQILKRQIAVPDISGILTDCKILAYLHWYRTLQAASWYLESFYRCIYATANRY